VDWANRTEGNPLGFVGKISESNKKIPYGYNFSIKFKYQLFGQPTPVKPHLLARKMTTSSKVPISSTLPPQSACIDPNA
jgi:hypothetical protein